MIRLVAVMSCVMAIHWVQPIAAAELHVAPNGAADAPGKAERPLADLEQARDIIRDWKKNGKIAPDGVTVWVHGGDYIRERSFTLTSADSGAAESPIVYRSWPGETPRLLGGKRVQPAAWHSVSDPQVVARLARPAHGNVLVADLKLLGISRFAPLGGRFKSLAGTPELFFDGKPMQLARWPNGGWVTIERVIDRGSTGEVGESRGVARSLPRTAPAVGRSTAASGSTATGATTGGECLRVAAVDAQKREIVLAAPHSYGIGPSSSWNREPRRYCHQHAGGVGRSRRMVPGPRKRHALFWPPKPIKDADVLLSTLDQPMIVLEGCERVTIRGLRLEASCGEGIVVRGGRQNLVAGCTVTNLGGTAISISEGAQNGVTSCDMSSLARNGITLSGGDRKTLTPAGNFAVNNHIHHFGRLQRTYAAGIHLNGVGNRVANNLIHDAPHMAVLFGGNENVMELNEIHNVCQETGDVGVFYTGRDWTTRAT